MSIQGHDMKSIFGKSTICLILLILASSLKAEPSNLPSVSVVPGEWSDVTQEKANAIESKLGSLANEFKDHLVSGFDLTVSLHDSGENPSYGNKRISSPLVFEFRHPDTGIMIKRSEEESYSIILHEFGHWIFEQSLLSSVPQWSNYTAAKHAHIQINPEYRTLLRERDFGVISDEGLARIEVLKPEIDRLNEELESYPFRDFIESYNELFADLFAVLVSNKPRTFRNLIEFPTENPHYLQVAYSRDFSQEHTFDISGEVGAYLFFAPSKFFFWELLRKSDLSRADKVDAVLRAIAEDINQRVKNAELNNASIEQHNLRLQDLVRRQIEGKKVD